MTRRGSPAGVIAVALALLAGRASLVLARDIPAAPSTYVLDESGWLDASEEARLSQELLDYERETSNQIVVAVFDSLGDEDLADFSHRVAEAWKVGQSGRDNGILLAIYEADRLIDIEVGYGLEPVVTDAIAHEIRTGILVPALRAGEPAAGIFRATSALMDAARGEFKGTGQAASDQLRPPSKWPIILFLILFLLVSALSSRFRGGGPFVLGPPGYGRGGRLSRGGGFFPGGGGGFLGGGGGGGGGGFRGGGGSFGGGGARGGW